MTPQRGGEVTGWLEDGSYGLFACSRRYQSEDRGKQPLSNEDGTVWVACDGDIWNSSELREQLEARGHRFGTRVPSEVLAHLYEDAGADMVRHVRGSFAFAVVDRGAGRVLLVRDHMGSKPMYCTVVNGDLLFGSEMRPLRAAGAGREVNAGAIHHYLSYGTVPSPYSVYADVYCLRPASACTWDGCGKVESHAYWDYSFHPTAVAPPDEIAHNLQGMLLDTIGRILAHTDGQYGVTLSGGIDSTAVTGMVTELSGRRIPTFFLGYEEPGLVDSLADEREYARLVARHYDTDHREIFVTPARLFKALPRVVELLEQPMETTGFEYFLSEASAQGVDYLLTGDTADSLFCGTSYYSVLVLLERYRRLPRWVHGLLGKVMPRIPRDTRVFGKHPRVVYDALSNASEVSAWERYYCLKALFREDEKFSLYTDSMRKAVGDANTLELTASYFAGVDLVNPIEETLRVMQKREIPDIYLLDSLQAGRGGELRSPFVDRDIVAYVARIPWQLKFYKGFQKYILVQACRKYLPEAIIHRPKRGFSLSAFDLWLRREPWSRVVEDCLSQDAVEARGVFRWDAIAPLLEGFRNGTRSSRRIWSLVMLELWYRRFVDGQPLESEEWANG